MHRVRVVCFAAVLGLAACAGKPARQVADDALALIPADTRRFGSEAELVAWMAQGRTLAQQGSDVLDERRERLRIARCRRGELPRYQCREFFDEDESVDEDASELDTIQVTGSRVTGAHLGFDRITNNQEAAVDEGDIVKKAGDFLFVLSNGVLSVVRIRDRGHDTLELTDRLVVDEDGVDETWYDEILAQGDRVFLLGYRFAHRSEVSELRAFRLDAAGRLQRDGVYWLRSQDYFDATNYGLRLHDGHLVMTLTLPLDLRSESIAWPEWSRRDVATPTWAPLLRAEDLYYPVYPPADTLSMHVVLRCATAALDLPEPGCRATGVVGDDRSTIYVSGANTWLAVGGVSAEAVRRGHAGPLHAWDDTREAAPWSVARTAIYRIPHDGGAPQFATIAGGVHDQFDFAEVDRGLWLAAHDGRRWSDEHARVRLYRIDDTALVSRRGTETPPLAEVRLDTPLDTVRFGRRGLWLAGARRHPDTYRSEGHSQVRVIPLAGGPVATVPVDVQVETLQPLFDRMLVVGATEPPGLGLSLFTDAAAPRRLSTRHVDGRLSAESRSHALNFGKLPNGASLVGLPTLAIPRDVAFDDWDADEAADIEFFSLHGDALQSLGRVDMQDQVPVTCRHSCFDFYGAARLFFVGNRIFALSGTIMKEAEVLPGGLRTLRRVALAPEPARP